MYQLPSLRTQSCGSSSSRGILIVPPPGFRTGTMVSHPGHHLAFLAFFIDRYDLEINNVEGRSTLFHEGGTFETLSDLRIDHPGPDGVPTALLAKIHVALRPGYEIFWRFTGRTAAEGQQPHDGDRTKRHATERPGWATGDRRSSTHGLPRLRPSPRRPDLRGSRCAATDSLPNPFSDSSPRTAPPPPSHRA